jgi:hypothetical protein
MQNQLQNQRNMSLWAIILTQFAVIAPNYYRLPHKSQKLIYGIYIFAQFSKLELVQFNC